MIQYKDCQPADLLADAKESKDRREFLKEFAKTQVPNQKNGKMRKPTFFEIKRAYYEKFYPDLTPAAKPKKKTIFQLIDEL